MTMQFSADVRNAALDQVEVITGASPILQIRTGSVPANTAAADTGTVLAVMTLPADWLTAASGGAKNKNGTWSDTSADASGTAGHFRIKNAAGTVTHIQGTITVSGGGGDMTVSSLTLTETLPVDITSFVLSISGA